MRKVIVFNMVSLDGFFEAPGGNIDWHQVDNEFNEFAIEQLNSAGGLIFGRVTYELMVSYWPTPEGIRDDAMVAERMNSIPKFVFSRTLDKLDWNNSQLINGNAVEEIIRLKQQPGQDLFMFGSAELIATIMASGVIDEYRIIVAPIILGSGTPLFKDVKAPIQLKLFDSRVFGNGNVLLYYRQDK